MKRTALTLGRVLALCLSLIFAPDARAGSVITLSPEAVLANSDTAFSGRVVSITPRWTGKPGRSSIWTDYVFEVDDILADGAGLIAQSARGPNGATLFVLPILGGRIGDEEQTAHGVPTFSVGERAFIFTAKSQQGAICPALGWWQGVYRIRTVNGRELVTHIDGCCAPAAGAAVDRHFFAKFATTPAGFTPAEFAAEVRRAMPIAEKRDDLKLEAMRALPEKLPPTAFTSQNLSACSAAAEAAVRGPAERAMYTPPASAQVPPHEIVMLAPSSTDADVVLPAARPPVLNNRYGYTSDEPDYPWRFNIAPNMGVFAGDVSNDMGYWNQFTGFNLFYTYNNPTNTFGWDNSRNEVGFATDAVLSSQGGGTWGTGIGLCRTLSRGGEIKEADVYFNLNPGTMWTLDYTTAFNSSAGMNGNPILLFQRTCIHEMGHSFGLEHQWIPNPGAQFPSVMNYVPAWLRYDSAVIYADDANGLRAGYPEFSIFLTDATVELWHQNGAMTSGNNDTVITNITPTSVQRGNTVQVGSGSSFFTVTNPGTTLVNPRADFYLCPTNGSFDGSIYCGSSPTPTLQQGDSVLLQRNFIVPPATNPGAYYVGVNLVVSGDEIGWNNTTWSYQPITVTAAAPPNDQPGTATLLSCVGGSVSATTFGATASGYNACFSGNGPDVWYRLTPCATGFMTVDSCGSTYDTVVQILDAGLANVNCNDDAIAGPCNGSRQSYVTANVSGGNVYYIRVAGYQGATGNFNLNIRVQPANDSCSTGSFCASTAYLPLNTDVFGTTLGATASTPGDYPPCPFLDPFVGEIPIENQPDVWYAFDAPCSGTVSINTEGSPLTQVAVYDRCYCFIVVTHPLLVSCGYPTFGSFNPIAEFAAVGGQRYHVRVRGVLGPGNFVIRARYSAPDDYCDALFGVRTAATLTPEAPVADLPFDTACANPSNIGPLPGACFDGATFDPGNDQIVGINVQTTGTLNITRCFGSYLPSVALYTGNCLEGLHLYACGYVYSSSCDPIVVSTPVAAGQYLFLRVAGHTSYAPLGGYTTLHLTVDPPAFGACCFADGRCESVAAGDCAGIYVGDNAACDPTPCPQPTGACCVSPADCRILTAVNCAAAGGAYTGDGIPCQVDPGNIITCCIANFNGVNGITVQDIFDFLAAYFAGDHDADLNGNGLGVQDIFDFLAAYFAGC
jgi:hypothetical protein